MHILLLAALVAAPALAAGEDDWKELGVEAKGGTTSADEAVSKAKTLDGKYERAKAHAASLLGGAPSREASPRPEKSLPDASQETVHQKTLNDSTVVLKNGQMLTDVNVMETTDKGYWVETEGTRLFLEKGEVARIEKRTE
jgi:hypothetical protein